MEAGSNKKTAPSISERLALVQQEVKVPKTETGRFGKHRNVEGILENLKPSLKKHGLSLVMDNDMVELGGRNYVKAVATVIDETGAQITATAFAWEGDISRGLDAPQVTGAASSYARKYALGGLFAIDDSKDPDSHNTAPNPENELQTVKPIVIAKPQKDTDPATPQQKQQLKNMMTGLEMDAVAMGLMVESVLEKPTVDTFGDFKKVLAAMEETSDGKTN